MVAGWEKRLFSRLFFCFRFQVWSFTMKLDSKSKWDLCAPLKAWCDTFTANIICYQANIATSYKRIYTCRGAIFGFKPWDILSKSPGLLIYSYMLIWPERNRACSFHSFDNHFNFLFFPLPLMKLVQDRICVLSSLYSLAGFTHSLEAAFKIVIVVKAWICQRKRHGKMAGQTAGQKCKTTILTYWYKQTACVFLFCRIPRISDYGSS